MAKRSRHYRAVKKEVQQKPIPANGIFIKNDEKGKLILASAGIAVVLFILGAIAGYLIGSDE